MRLGDMPLGKRAYWPIYAAAARAGAVVGIHAGQRLITTRRPRSLWFLPCRGLRRPGAGVQTQLTAYRRRRPLPCIRRLDGECWMAASTGLPAYLCGCTVLARGANETPWSPRAAGNVRAHPFFSLSPIDARPILATLNRLFEP